MTRSLDESTPHEKADALWARAREIAARYPGMDVEGVFHALQNLERPPAERLRRGLSRGRFRADVS